jgi:hypothetical protein
MVVKEHPSIEPMWSTQLTRVQQGSKRHCKCGVHAYLKLPPYEGLHRRSGHGSALVLMCSRLFARCTFRNQSSGQRVIGWSSALIAFFRTVTEPLKHVRLHKDMKIIKANLRFLTAWCGVRGRWFKQARQHNSQTLGWSNIARARGTSNGSSERR